MKLYLVTHFSVEEDSAGITERLETVVYGVYTTKERADAIAEKWDGNVSEFHADLESNSIVERWTNPGYIS